MSSIIYNLAIRLYRLTLYSAAYFNTKAALFLSERKVHTLRFTPKNNTKRIWIHCASLGEFDQALPVISELKKQENTEIFISFFSPSGYRQVADRSKYADLHFFYLPLDLPSKVKFLIESLNPDLVLFVKYELWQNLLKELYIRKIPVYLFSAYFHERQAYFKFPFRKFYQRIFSMFSGIYVLNDESKNLLIEKKIGVPIIVTGDTRMAQCIHNTEESYSDRIIEDFCRQNPTIICGSTWPIDEKLIAEFSKIDDAHNFLIAPHRISEKHLLQIEKLFPESIRYTQARESKPSRILILDTIGALKYAYRFGMIAYVGGGFTGRLHNVLEPAAYGIPVIIGPKTRRFPEAAIMKEKQMLKTIEYHASSLKEAVGWFSKEENRRTCQLNGEKFFFSNLHAAKTVIKGIKL
jgi:3-deoxy-D-manno-octulosonic-acid transferase